MRKFAHDGIREGDCDARRRSSRRKIALSRARSISRSIGATPQPRRPRRNCASSAAFHSRAAESVSCTVCRMCGGVCEYVRHAAEFMRFRCPACARRRELPARGACRAGDGVFSEFTNRITLLKQRKSKSKRKKHILSEHCCRVPFVPASNDGVEASSPFPDSPLRRIPSA